MNIKDQEDIMWISSSKHSKVFDSRGQKAFSQGAEARKVLREAPLKRLTSGLLQFLPRETALHAAYMYPK